MSDAVLGFLMGGLVGAAAAAWAVRVFVLLRGKPKVEITIDPAVLSEINGAMVGDWLDQHGLVAMPKGQEFRWPREVRR